MFLISTIVLLLTLIKPKTLTWLNKGWIRLGIILGKIMNPIILGIIFFGVFTPISIFFKFSGRDELKLKKYKKNSFWLNYKESYKETKSLKNQF